MEKLRSFLELCGWFFQFVPEYATSVSTMAGLLKRDVTYGWTSKINEAFQALKAKTVSCSTLAAFNPKARSYVTTEASDQGIGAVVSQVDCR